MDTAATDRQAKKARYWIESGMIVRLKWGGPKMTVMRILQVRETLHDGTKVTKMQGVKCLWIDDFGDAQTGRFHSGDLVKA